jgi:hypothetical protein
MSKTVFWILIAVLTAIALGTVFVICRHLLRNENIDYVVKIKKKEKEVKAAKLANRINHSGKEELLNNTIKLLQKNDQAALWYVMDKPDREFLLKKYNNDQQKAEKIFCDFMLKCANDDWQKFRTAMLRNRIPGVYMVENEGKWFIVPAELLGRKNVDF